MDVLGVVIHSGISLSISGFGFPTFAVLDKGIPALRNFNEEVAGWLPLLPEVHLPRLTGLMLADVVQRKGATAGSLDG